MKRDVLDAVAEILRYPDADRTCGLIRACDLIARDDEFPGEGALALSVFLNDSTPEDAEEHYTRTFDINPVCSLEMGWHLYGEDYARGAMLVEMRQLLRALGVEEGTELPDHLTAGLRVLGRLPEGKAGLFSTTYVQPALFKMNAGFDDKDSPYRQVLRDLLTALEAEYGETQVEAVDVPATQAEPYECGSSCALPPQYPPKAYTDGVEVDHARKL